MHKNTQIAKDSISKIVNSIDSSIQIELQSSIVDSREISFENRKMSELVLSSSYHLGVRLIRGDQESFFSTESVEEEDLNRLCKQQIKALDYVKKNPNIVSAPKMDELKIPFLDTYSKDKVSLSDKIERIKNFESDLWNCDPSVKNVRYASYSESDIQSDLINASGNAYSSKKTRYSQTGEILCQSGDSLASDGYGVSRYNYEDLLDNDELIQKIKERAVPLLNSVIPKTGMYPVVINKSAFASFIGLIAPMCFADNVDKGFSLFENKLGQKVASPFFQLTDEPHNLKAGACTSFDGEGFVTKNNSIIKDGVLTNYLSNLEYAKKMNIEHTHNATRSGSGKLGISSTNLVVRPGTMKPSVLKGMRPQLIEIVNIQGLHAGFNEASGDFSFQAEGFLYDMGTRAQSLQNFVCSGNLLTMLNSIADIGSDLSDTGGRILCPDVLIEEMQIVGK